jgi:hypothetical protein
MTRTEAEFERVKQLMSDGLSDYTIASVSADIRSIFVDHCRLLGIRVTPSNHRNLSVAHLDSVAILEEAVGPKT